MKITINNMKKRSLLLASLIFVVLSINFVFAFGVSSTYYDANPLNMRPGESRIIDLRLQNTDSDDDLIVESSIIEGSDVASLVEPGKKYEVLAGQKGIKVYFQIDIPEDAEIGDTYSFQASFTSSAATGGGPMTFGIDINKRVPIIVGEGEPEPTPNISPPPPALTGTTPEKPSEGIGLWLWILLILVALVVIIIIIILYAKRKKESNLGGSV